MASGCYKASPPFLFPSTQQQVLLILLCLAFMMTPFVMTGTTTRASNTTFTKGCIKEERDALLAFKAQIIYHNAHPISSWGHHIIDDCCHWPAVHCDNISGHVVRLNLQGTGPRQDHYECGEWVLSGNISVSLIGLRHLTYLDLSGNCFLNISIPKLLGSLENLVHLDLHDSGFTGVIPHELGNLTRLRYLNLATVDRLKVDDAEWLSGLSSLRYLLMDGVNFSGVNNVMQSLNKLRHLKNVSLYDCSMNSIPESLPHLNFTSLTFMDIGSNMFDNTTSIPEWLFRIPNLHHLRMTDCGLTGTIPSSVGNATSLQFLDLSGNGGISGDMPRGFGDLCNLRLLNLDGTFLGKNLEENFRDAFSGCIRRNLNEFSFGGSLLQGPLPDWLGEFRNLTGLFLSYNSFNGEFPLFLKKCTSVTTLALDHNNLSGKIPSWVGESMTSIMILTLKENNFSGNLPLLSNLKSLHFLDLSRNSFVGSIPQSYGNLRGMINGSMNGGASFFSNISRVLVITMIVSTKRVNLEYGVILSAFKSIDLSANNLSGRIPKEIVNLVGLQNLDLSHNTLSGEIPSDIGRMQSLESLDLSRNELFGSIPPGLSTLPFLEILNLSYNNLSGKIPFGGQLNTFPNSIYAGNLNLCGAPLDKNCTSDEEPQAHRQDDDQEDDDDNDSEPTWFYIGLMPGFYVGFWIVWGILLFKKEWRYAYFRFMDHMYDMVYVKIVVTIAKIKRA